MGTLAINGPPGRKSSRPDLISVFLALVKIAMKLRIVRAFRIPEGTFPLQRITSTHSGSLNHNQRKSVSPLENKTSASVENGQMLVLVFGNLD
jgi:hypothetical protein